MFARLAYQCKQSQQAAVDVWRHAAWKSVFSNRFQANLDFHWVDLWEEAFLISETKVHGWIIITRMGP